MTAREADPAPGLIDVIVRIAERLPDAQAQAWAEVLRHLPHPGSDVEAALIGASSGGGPASLASDLAAAWRSDGSASGAELSLALLAASRASERSERHRAQVVITGPSSGAGTTRLTGAAVTQLIGSARRELLVVSYAAHRSARLVGALAAASKRGVRVDLVLEESTNAADAFSGLAGQVGIWQWPAGQRGAGGKAALHAKVIAADRSEALVGSANLTGRALNDNIEVGILLRDPRAVGRIVAHFRSLMRDKGPLYRLDGSG